MPNKALPKAEENLVDQGSQTQNVALPVSQFKFSRSSVKSDRKSQDSVRPNEINNNLTSSFSYLSQKGEQVQMQTSSSKVASSALGQKFVQQRHKQWQAVKNNTNRRMPSDPRTNSNVRVVDESSRSRQQSVSNRLTSNTRKTS